MDRDEVEVGQGQISDILGIGKAAEKLAPAAIKVAEALQGVIAIVSEPATLYLSHRAEGAANRHEVLADAKAVLSIDQMHASDPAMAASIKARLLATETRRETNIANGKRKAFAIAEGMPAGQAYRDIDPDFVQEWIEGVKDISSEELQNVWAELLAKAPSLPNGRVSKPAVELLKQFDANVVRMFSEFLRYVSLVGWPSTSLTQPFSPFGVTVDVELLLDMGLIEPITVAGIKIPWLGFVQQTPRSSNYGLPLQPTINVFRLKARAHEIANAISEDFPIDHPNLEELRRSYIVNIAGDRHWDLSVGAKQNEFGYVIFGVGNNADTAANLDEINIVIQSDQSLSSQSKNILSQFAESRRLKLASPVFKEPVT
ncbi:DUF2806 domain-containing protein [Rhizobium miluonense]|uniref:DUF2806 domain-containing protein n=1 Tax=Rhizobium miluonense TaxID=411945 RepID=A0A1C3XAD5_9HYPH|nr:DUF2806 domain-containing protein [Rhizobium miluonense]SCB49096.1 Protein of unknown function [Rhizobium miluonense]